MQLKKRIESYLRENTGPLAINFSGLTNIEQEALLKFFKKLRGYKERIKIINIDALKTEMADVVKYARDYFEVLVDENDLLTA